VLDLGLLPDSQLGDDGPNVHLGADGAAASGGGTKVKPPQYSFPHHRTPHLFGLEAVHGW